MTNHIDPSEFFKRLFEPFPADGMTRFRVGDSVRLVRQERIFGVPAGAIGEVLEVDVPGGNMTSKGRPYYVRLDLRPFNIPIPVDLRRVTLTLTGQDEPYYTEITTYLSPNDLERVPDVVEESLFWNNNVTIEQRVLLRYLREHVTEVQIGARNGSRVCRDLLDGYALWQQSTNRATLAALVATIRDYRQWVVTCEFTALTGTVREMEAWLEVPDQAHRVYRKLEELGYQWSEQQAAWRRIE